MNIFFNCFLLVFLSFYFTKLNCQNNNFYLKSILNNNIKINGNINLLIDYQGNNLQEFVSSIKGKVKLKRGNLASVIIPKKNLNILLENKNVKRVQFSLSKGMPLNDSMLIKNNVVPIHNGLSPLISKYNGKGIIIGFIDVGIDITHPDFRDSTGRTRILYLWDQAMPYDSLRTPQPYNYGQVWDSTDINNDILYNSDTVMHFERFWSHGSNVVGVAASNGLATGNYSGVAPEANIIMVASDFNKANWLSTVVDACDFIFKIADSLSMPCVINASVGDYLGSHDGKDIAAQLIDSLIKEKPGRALVCAAGNAGSSKFHLRTIVNSDTSFTWFKYNPSSALGYGAVFFELWADTADFNNVYFSVGADKTSPSYEFRGRTKFDNIKNRLNQLVSDSIVNDSGNVIAIVDTWAEEQNGTYLLQVHLQEPDSNQYFYRFMTTGNGKFDIWSAEWLGTSDMISTGLPSSVQFPDIIHYQMPDTFQTIVSSFQCLPSTITVANYANKKSYLAYNDSLVIGNYTPGDLYFTSSKGPTRIGIIKPDIAASGSVTITTCNQWYLQNQYIPLAPYKVAKDGMHIRQGGTSISSSVVAGIAALFLEQCPKSDFQDIKNAIVNTAFSDTFTGIVPNEGWGYGKVDAFAALVSQTFKDNLNAYPDTSVCEGDSITISTSGTYDSYLWNTGDTSATISTDTVKSFYAQLVNSLGCKGFSDTLTTNIRPRPQKPIIFYSGNTVCTSLADSYQWYLNGNPIQGANSLCYDISQTGYYYVEVFDTVSNCSSFSDTLYLEYTGIEEFKNLNTKIFPNPILKGNKIIVCSENLIKNIKIINLTGSLISNINSNSKTVKIDTYQLSQGQYIIKISYNNNSYNFFEINVLE